MKKIITMAMAVALMTACTHSDILDEGNRVATLKDNYTQNFRNAYPNTNLNQSWDYSLKNTAYGLPASAASAAPTRAGNAVDYNFKKNGEYEVDNNTLAWLKEKLVEEKDNRDLGSPLYMNVPNNAFTIVPIFQGQAGGAWNLHMVVNGVDILVWEKSNEIWRKTSATADWQELRTLNVGEDRKNTLNAAAVKATQYTFENLPAGADMYFYLEITKVGYISSKPCHALRSQMSSLNGMMLALQDCPRPANIDEDNEVMILSFEDADFDNSDWDMNDVVFLVYAKPDVPKPIKIEEGTPVTQTKTVRYMIEDLGSTDDFDFNDIVVDVSEIRTTTPIYSNGVLSSWEETDYRQEATIRHLGGTLPFRLKIGDTQLEERKGQLGSDPNETFEVTGWDINAHNVSVEVQSAVNETLYNNVKFPKAGEAPMIIAVEPTVNWMDERVSVPEDWFYIPEE